VRWGNLKREAQTQLPFELWFLESSEDSPRTTFLTFVGSHSLFLLQNACIPRSHNPHIIHFIYIRVSGSSLTRTVHRVRSRPEALPRRPMNRNWR